MKVGFVGLGNIGKPMALRLAAAEGIELAVYDVVPEPVAELVAAGATAAPDVGALGAEVVCVMVRDDAQVREVARLVGPGPVLVVHSTVAPGTPAELATEGLTVLDAPVSGGPMGAADGSLAIMVGGSGDAFDVARPALDAMGSKVVSDRGPVLRDDPHTSPYLKPPSFISGGGGLVSTAADYLRFSRMLLQGGELDGVRLLGPKTLALMTANHLPGGRDMSSLSSPSMFSEAAYDGVGFGLGFATTISQAATLIPGSTGDFFWGGAAGTFFWVDPQEDLIGLFLTQVLPSSAYPVRRQLRTLVYSAITDVGGAAR